MRIFFTIILCSIFLLSLSSCVSNDLKEERHTLASAEQIVQTKEIKTSYLIEKSEKNNICVAYPIVYSIEFDRVNAAVYDFVYKKVSQICADGCDVTNSVEKFVGTSSEYSLYLLEIDYEIVFYSNEMISITFEGLFNYKNSAHPVHIFFTLNLDPESGQPINFADMYTINDALYDIFSKYAQEDLVQRMGGTWPENWGTFSEEICNRDHFLNGLTSASDFHIFYSKEGVGISYPVPYVMGDHLEVILPYSELQKIIIRRGTVCVNPVEKFV